MKEDTIGWRRLPAAAATVVALALSGCGAEQGAPQGQETAAEQAAQLPAGHLELELNGETTQIDTASVDIVEPTTLHAGAPLPVQVTLGGDTSNAAVSVQGMELRQKGNTFTGEITLEALDPDITVPVVVKQGGEVTEFEVRTTPLDMPPVVFEGSTEFDHGTFYYANLFPTERTRDYIVKYDNTGAPVFYRNHEELTYNNFAPWEGENDRGYSYFVEDPEDVSGFGIRRGRYVVLDENYRIIEEEARPKPTKSYDPAEGPFAEMHDFLVLGPTHYLFLDYYVAEVDESGVSHYVPYIQEQKNGRVVWEWDSWDHELFRQAGRAGYVRLPDEDSMQQAEVYDRDEAIAAGAFTDAIHTNSVHVCPNDGNIIISNRHMDAVMEIERGTGELAWVLGGEHNTWDTGALGGLDRQHDARMLLDASGNPLLSIYDNRTEMADTSRGLVLEVDEDNRQILGVEEYVAHGQKGDFTGSTRLFGENLEYVMVGWGLVRPEPVLATIFDRQGNVLKDITTDGLMMDGYRFVPGDF